MLIVAALTIVNAILQWLLIFERSCAALWARYKFHGYGPVSPISVNEETQLLFFVESVAVALLALTTLRRGHSPGNQYISQKLMVLGRWAGYAIILGLIWWAILLASPLVIVIRR